VELCGIIVRDMAKIAPRSRFDGWPRWASVATLVALIGAILLSLTAGTKSIQTGPPPSGPQMSDPELYQHMIDSVGAGESYYQAIGHWHREGGFPLKPFVTVRMPTLAYLSAAIGLTGRMMLIGLLAVTVIFAWRRRLNGAGFHRLQALAATGFIAVSSATFIMPVMTLFHEGWAALLIALSLALRTSNRFAASVALGLTAVLVRELALGYLILMLCIAAYERRGREALAWLGAIAIFGVALALHAYHVSLIVREGDLASSGWNALGGWPLYISVTATATPLIHLPEWVARIVIPLCFFGWWSVRSEITLRVLGLIAGYCVMIMVFARPNTFYWGIIITPLLLGGLAFVPNGLSKLTKQAVVRD
jgi:hypothetical protein